jgi:hypothetical protein
MDEPLAYHTHTRHIFPASFLPAACGHARRSTQPVHATSPLCRPICTDSFPVLPPLISLPQAVA